jgi:hypothetical protein
VNLHVPLCTVSIVLKKPLVIRSPSNSIERTKIVPRDEPYLAVWSSGRDWLVLPEFQNRGLTRRDWARHWHDLTVDMFELRGEQWQDLFNDNEPYE